jgi:hypothetical protein
MLLRDEDQHLLARIHWGPGKLYKVDMRIAQPVCIAVCTGRVCGVGMPIFGISTSHL